MDIPIGAIVQFRYQSSHKKRLGFNRPRVILVLNPNYDSQLHGLQIQFLSPAQQEVLQNVFMKMYGQAQSNVLVPMEQRIQQLRQELEILNKQQNQSVRQQTKTVMTPQAMGGMVQAIKTVKSAASSMFNKIRTFGRTQVQPQPINNQQQVTAAVTQNDALLKKKNDELTRALTLYQQQQGILNQIPDVPRDPYMFYHQFLKPYIGNSKVMKTIYRKFDVGLIQTPRIERLPR